MSIPRAGPPMDPIFSLKQVSETPLSILDDGSHYIASAVRGAGGDYFLSDRHAHRFLILTPEGDTRLVFGSRGTEIENLQYPFGLACRLEEGGERERILLADSWNHRVLVFSYDSKGGDIDLHHIVRSQDGGFETPGGLAVEEDGSFWVASARRSRIVRLNADFTPRETIGVMRKPPADLAPGLREQGAAPAAGAPVELFCPSLLALIPGGDLLVADEPHGRVQRVRDGALVVSINVAGALTSISGMIATNQLLFVADRFGGRIAAYSLEGFPLAVWDVDARPGALLVEDGRLVAFTEHGMRRYETQLLDMDIQEAMDIAAQPTSMANSGELQALFHEAELLRAGPERAAAVQARFLAKGAPHAELDRAVARAILDGRVPAPDIGAIRALGRRLAKSAAEAAGAMGECLARGTVDAADRDARPASVLETPEDAQRRARYAGVMREARAFNQAAADLAGDFSLAASLAALAGNQDEEASLKDALDALSAVADRCREVLEDFARDLGNRFHAPLWTALHHEDSLTDPHGWLRQRAANTAWGVSRRWMELRRKIQLPGKRSAGRDWWAAGDEALLPPLSWRLASGEGALPVAEDVILALLNEGPAICALSGIMEIQPAPMGDPGSALARVLKARRLMETRAEDVFSHVLPPVEAFPAETLAPWVLAGDFLDRLAAALIARGAVLPQPRRQDEITERLRRQNLHEDFAGEKSPSGDKPDRIAPRLVVERAVRLDEFPDGKLLALGGVALHGEHLWVLPKSENSRLGKYTLEGERVLEVGLEGPNGTPFPLGGLIGVDENGGPVIMDGFQFQVRHFDAAGNLLSWFGKTGEETHDLEGLYNRVLDRSGKTLWVSFLHKPLLRQYELDGKQRSEMDVSFAFTVSDDGPQLVNIALDAGPRGVIHLLNRVTGTLYRIEPDGKASRESRQPAWMANSAGLGGSCAVTVLDDFIVITQYLRRFIVLDREFRFLGSFPPLDRSSVFVYPHSVHSLGENRMLLVSALGGQEQFTPHIARLEAGD